MYIQEVIIDGFKSYAHRTVVQGFDPHFNAITGLNGSGKSNILDAICFVLGITNLSQVRAGNLSELVYKQGQAGVNKAIVTIVFNNEDPENSPVGFESCHEVSVTRQVTMGSKNKYYINGKVAQASSVQNLFHSVQLNVNNPHFLIMQGRITKVLNMKANEILGMVEEAAGTRMYETKRVAALKTIDKKQAKLEEINSVLEEEITPTLERLRGEKQNYLKWSKNKADLDRLKRFCIAYQYYQAQQALTENTEGLSAMEDQVRELDEQAKGYRAQAKEKEKEMNQMMSSLKGKKDEELEEIKKIEQARSNDLVRITSKWNNCKSNVEKAENDLNAANLFLDEAKTAVATKETEIADETAACKETVQAAKQAEQELECLQNEYQTMSAGMSTSSENRTLPEQISQAHADSKNAESKVDQAKLKLKHLSKELKSVEKEIQKQGKSAEKLADKKDAASNKVSDIEAQIKELNFSDTEYEALEEEKAQLESTISELAERVNTLQAQLNGRLGFQYSDPVRGFDRSKVKGLVAKLIEVKDSKNATALEVTAGGKLYQVVVDDQITGRALLERGKLKQRVTIIPLDQINSRHIANSSVQRAESIAKSRNATAVPAIELVGFDEEVRSAMEYVFGTTIVVDNAKAANDICDQTKTRTVTLDGDTYDPSGMISGGSSGSIGTVLSRLMELAEARQELDDKKFILKDVSLKLKALQSASSAYEKLISKLAVAQAEFEASEKHLSQTNFGMLVEKRKTFTADLKTAEEEIEIMTKEKEDKWALYEELKEQEVVLTQQREERLGDIEKAVKEGKIKSEKLSKRAREVDSRLETLALELESLKAEVEAAKEAVRIAQKALDEASNIELESQMQVGEIQASYEEARGELDQLEKEIANQSSAVLEMKAARKECQKKADSAALESKKIALNIEQIKKDREAAKKTADSIANTEKWLKAENNQIGVAGGDYDFEANDPKEAVKKLSELQSEYEHLDKNVNKKVMALIEKAESEYAELLRKRKVVENDKKKIQNVIKELDVKKKTELQMTWQKVNRDFGSVFSTLLSGASAKLEPPEGMEAWEGLEVKVAFGNVWKESLTELSGGQRSLLALSLILSLLLFKPAPMYILDEVDAALDLSHTQNIGNMLKTHFSQSQFIVVSLKEGMFNNANVIFRTKFVDGVSTVTRTIGTGSSRAQPQTLTDSNTDEATTTSKIATASRRSRKRGKENA